MADAPQMSVAEMVEAIRLDPKLDVNAVIERKRF
jgi:hypothetical protein